MAEERYQNEVQLYRFDTAAMEQAGYPVHENRIKEVGPTEQRELKEIVDCVYRALVAKGYRPVDQLIGYILTEDPTYITNHNGARNLVSRIDRHELLRDILLSYFEAEDNQRARTGPGNDDKTK